MDDLTTTTGIVALAAVALALAALVAGTVALVRLRHLRAAQRVILGGHGERDLVTHGAELTEGFEALRDWIEDRTMPDRVASSRAIDVDWRPDISLYAS